MINLTEKDKEIIKHLGYPKVVELSSGSYLIKADYANKGVNELIGKKLADIMGLICPRYFLVEVENERYLLSEDLNQYGSFITGLELSENNEDGFISYSMNSFYRDETWYDKDAEHILHGNSLYDIWVYFEKNYPYKIQKQLIAEILKVYMFDILFLNYDRDSRNWGILKQKDQVNVVILDNEMIFSQKRKEILYKSKNKDSLGINNEDSILAETVALTSDFSETHPSVYEDFRKFLKESSSEFTDLIKYYIDLITPEFLRIIIEQIERNESIIIETKEKMIETYRTHRASLIEIYAEEIKKGDNHAR